MLAGRNGARGRSRTRTGDALDVVSLLLDYASDENWIIGLVDDGCLLKETSNLLERWLGRGAEPAGFWWLPLGRRFNLRL